MSSLVTAVTRVSRKLKLGKAGSGAGRPPSLLTARGRRQLPP